MHHGCAPALDLMSDEDATSGKEGVFVSGPKRFGTTFGATFGKRRTEHDDDSPETTRPGAADLPA